jgi:hypothetical protein
VPGGTGFSVDSQGTAWGNAFILRCGSGAASSFFLDFDGDGFGDLSNPALACMLPGGYAANGDDCDDAESAINPGAAEVCDGNDTNCDGTVDGGPSCATGQPGVCAAGVETCVEASLECLPVTASSPEVCDTLDNDCDGLADESLAQECFDGNPGQIGIGICQAGIQTCTAGSFGTCEGQVPPQAEMCNGLDDDCNGVVDDGLSLTEPLYPPDLGLPIGAACGTGDCAGGTVICSGDGTGAVCSTDLNRTPEVCNGLDNDCDGVVDDGC